MPENGDANIRPLFLDELGQESEVIILHQNDGVVLAFHFFEHGAGEFAVDLLIGLPIFHARKIGRVCAMWQSGQMPSLANP